MRVLVDTSAWVDYLRGDDSPTTSLVRSTLTDEGVEVLCCEPVAMELLVGARDEGQARKLERLVNGLTSLTFDPWADFRDAALLYRTARDSGETIRSITDCLIAAIALNHGVTVLHRDRDFEVLAHLTGLSTRTAS